MLLTDTESPFLRTIEQLLTTSKLVLYGRIDVIAPAELAAVLDLLHTRYEQEAIGYPGTPPEWDAAAAEWSAKVLFYAGQLVLYRHAEVETLTEYFPKFMSTTTPAAQLSADLCLRYLPALLHHLDAIHPDDELIGVLRDLLAEWPYSGLLANPAVEVIDLTGITKNACLRQLYLDRVIGTKNKAVAERPELQKYIRELLGNHAATYWKALTPTL